MMEIILAACFLPIWPIIYFLMRNMTKPKKNIILGVTLPQSAHSADETQTICAAFLRALNIVSLPLLPLMIPPFFFTAMGTGMTWFMTWLLWLIVAPMAVFAVYRGRLLTVKRERGWFSEASGKALADIRAAVIPKKKVSWIWFFLPLVISFIPLPASFRAAEDWGWAAIYITFAAMTSLFWLFYHMIYRVRTEIVNENLTLTMALTRARRYQWSKFWVAAAWLTGLLNVAVWLFEDNVTALLTATLGYTVILIAVSLHTEFAARAAQQRLTAQNIGDSYVDEDDHWIWGLFYHNPNDHHFLVNDRIGMNMSVNLAKPGAKILMAFALLCMVAMPFTGIWMWAEESTPVRLELRDLGSGPAIAARHTRDVYVIPDGGIKSVELIDELPRMTRTAGTAFEHLLKGRFNAQGYGAVRVCLQTNSPPFLVITNEGGWIWILNDNDPDVTREVFAKLRGLQNG